jgi:hypothetical protein
MASLTSWPIDVPSKLGFDWHGQHVDARLTSRADMVLLSLRSKLGVLPFTAENPQLRRAILDAVGQLPSACRADLRSVGGAFWLESETLLEPPVSLQDVIGVSSIIILAFQPIKLALQG